MLKIHTMFCLALTLFHWHLQFFLQHNIWWASFYSFAALNVLSIFFFQYAYNKSTVIPGCNEVSFLHMSQYPGGNCSTHGEKFQIFKIFPGWGLGVNCSTWRQPKTPGIIWKFTDVNWRLYGANLKPQKGLSNLKVSKNLFKYCVSYQSILKG